MRISSSQKSIKSVITERAGRADATISFDIPVRPVMAGEMSSCGLINSIKRSLTFPSLTFKAPISIISLFIGSNPVVSRSKAI